MSATEDDDPDQEHLSLSGDGRRQFGHGRRREHLRNDLVRRSADGHSHHVNRPQRRYLAEAMAAKVLAVQIAEIVAEIVPIVAVTMAVKLVV